MLSESNILHEFDLDLVICESTNLNTAFTITLNPISNCGNDVEPAIHFFHCPLYSNGRRTLLSSLVNIEHMAIPLLTQKKTQK